jgi:hypothetical protein
MASHTQTELQLAAEAIGDAARALGIEPRETAPAPPERVAAYDAYEDELVAAGPAYDHLLDAPFDLERDGELPDGPVSPEQRERWLAAARPRGGEDDGEGPREQHPPEPTDATQAPFDGEAAVPRGPYDHARAA